MRYSNPPPKKKIALSVDQTLRLQRNTEKTAPGKPLVKILDNCDVIGIRRTWAAPAATYHE